VVAGFASIQYCSSSCTLLIQEIHGSNVDAYRIQKYVNGWQWLQNLHFSNASKWYMYFILLLNFARENGWKVNHYV